MRRSEAGNVVFDELSHSDSTLAEGVKNTGLTVAQWHSGLAYIRDVLGESNGDPILYDVRTRRYSLALTEVETDRYIAKRVNTFLIQMQRLYDGSFVPSGIKFDTKMTPRFRAVDKQITRLIADLGDIREDLGIPESAALKRRRNDREKAGL